MVITKGFYTDYSQIAKICSETIVSISNTSGMFEIPHTTIALPFGDYPFSINVFGKYFWQSQ